MPTNMAHSIGESRMNSHITMALLLTLLCFLHIQTTTMVGATDIDGDMVTTLIRAGTIDPWFLGDQKWSLRPDWSWLDSIIPRVFGEVENLFKEEGESVFFKIVSFVINYIGSFFQDSNVWVHKFIRWFLNSAINPLKGKFKSFSAYMKFSRYLVRFEEFLKKAEKAAKESGAAKCLTKVFSKCMEKRKSGNYRLDLLYCTFKFIDECGEFASEIISQSTPPPSLPPGNS